MSAHERNVWANGFWKKRLMVEIHSLILSEYTANSRETCLTTQVYPNFGVVVVVAILSMVLFLLPVLHLGTDSQSDYRAAFISEVAKQSSSPKSMLVCKEPNRYVPRYSKMSPQIN
ncbi:hypothetical protein CHS0354_031586 [Potamilus streckersoni]|uniref:Uncharacterized protein n=1 Tax=Potamilus streckersoni TaxID=2493646 RepID=A0AAE0VWC8_9BIVA|nr:hypothetical protein CHS0354_031586 [Potamilus streckersoni]